MKRFLSLVIALMVIFSMSALAEENLSLTTGLPTEVEDQKIIAVSIDNVGQGRPQRNMDCADVVYEIEIARGGYTRYLAIFNDNIPEIVEAVRSTRYIHIDLTSDWNAAFAHCGGASAATYNMYDYLKQFTFPGRFDYYKGDSHFYRDEKRAMPHNAVFKIQSAMEKVDTSVIAPRSPLSFSADNYTQRGEDCTSFKVKYNASGAVIDKAYYTVTYTQNSKKVNPKAAGKYDVTIKFLAPYSGTLTGRFTIKKAEQSAKVKVTETNKSVKKKTRTYTASIAEKAKVTSTRTKGSTKISCDGAKITVKKGARNVKATIRLTIKATKNYKATTRIITVKVNGKGEVSFTVK